MYPYVSRCVRACVYEICVYVCAFMCDRLYLRPRVCEYVCERVFIHRLFTCWYIMPFVQASRLVRTKKSKDDAQNSRFHG